MNYDEMVNLSYLSTRKFTFFCFIKNIYNLHLARTISIISLLHLFETWGKLILILTPLPLLWRLGSDCEADESLSLGLGAVQSVLSSVSVYCHGRVRCHRPVCGQPGTRGHQGHRDTGLGSRWFMLQIRMVLPWVKSERGEPDRRQEPGSSGWTTSGRLRTSPTLMWGRPPRGGSPPQWPSSRKLCGNKHFWPSSS